MVGTLGKWVRKRPLGTTATHLTRTHVALWSLLSDDAGPHPYFFRLMMIGGPQCYANIPGPGRMGGIRPPVLFIGFQYPLFYF